MIRPLAAMPAPPAKPNGKPTHDASASFLDWVLVQGGSAPAQPGAMPQPAASSGASALSVVAAPTPHGLSTDLFGAHERTDALAALATPTFAPDMASVSASLALRIEHRAGPVEIIALPWRLMATGGLAHVFGVRLASDAIAGNGMHAQRAGGGIATSAALVPGQIPDEPTGQAGPGVTTSVSFAAGAAMTAERFEGVEFDANVRADAQAALPWVARLLRWLDDHGEATLWVRDFRLGESDKRALVATLRTAAAQAGFRLDRIVINGRAHWHVHRPTRETSHAG